MDAKNVLAGLSMTESDIERVLQDKPNDEIHDMLCGLTQQLEAVNNLYRLTKKYYENRLTVPINPNA